LVHDPASFFKTLLGHKFSMDPGPVAKALNPLGGGLDITKLFHGFGGGGEGKGKADPTAAATSTTTPTTMQPQSIDPLTMQTFMASTLAPLFAQIQGGLNKFDKSFGGKAIPDSIRQGYGNVNAALAGQAVAGPEMDQMMQNIQNLAAAYKQLADQYILQQAQGGGIGGLTLPTGGVLPPASTTPASAAAPTKQKTPWG
jgi:hypothetical protein